MKGRTNAGGRFQMMVKAGFLKLGCQLTEQEEEGISPVLPVVHVSNLKAEHPRTEGTARDKGVCREIAVVKG